MLRSYKTEGIIVKRINFAETDKLVTILTKKHGKLVVLAKGIRKLHSRRASHLELFNYVKITLSCGRSFDMVTEAQTVESFPLLRTKLERIAFAYKIVEEVDRLCAEKQFHKNVFNFLLGTLGRINNVNYPELSLTVDEFSQKLLWELGYLPRDESITGDTLDKFFENVMERNLKSKSLLMKL